MRRLASFFLGLGVGIGVLGALGLATGFRPSQLPAGLLDISVYKLTFIAAVCVMAAGAFVRRRNCRQPHHLSTSAPPASTGHKSENAANRRHAC